MLPGEFEGHHLGPTAPNSGITVYQVDVVSSFEGWGPSYQIAKTFFKDFFYRGRDLVNGANTCRVVVRKGRIGPATREDTRYVLPMSVSVLAYMSM